MMIYDDPLMEKRLCAGLRIACRRLGAPGEILQELGEEFPEDPKAQLWGAVGAVFKSACKDLQAFWV